jgi:protein-S-isoprenylcysteine O-methyltransferase Ste14
VAVSAWRHLLAVVLLPGIVAVAVPAVILWRAEAVSFGWGLPSGLALLTVLLGAGLIALGLGLVAWTVALFAVVGRGTLAPWDPTSRLVVRGPYRHVRNPMITGVVAILAGEATLLGSPALAAWGAVVLGVNAIYMPLVEEPGLRRRFGEAYEVYRANVPRWVPRLRPWRRAAGPGASRT